MASLLVITRNELSLIITLKSVMVQVGRNNISEENIHLLYNCMHESTGLY